jgi:hypothetical protein
MNDVGACGEVSYQDFLPRHFSSLFLNSDLAFALPKISRSRACGHVSFLVSSSKLHITMKDVAIYAKVAWTDGSLHNS